MESDEIEEMTASCKKQFLQHLKKGGDPFPTGFIFSDIPDNHDDSTITIITMPWHIESLNDLEELAEHVRACSPRQAIAAGMVFYINRHAWSSLQKEPRAAPNVNSQLDFVGVTHVEHRTNGYQTWTIDLDNMNPSPEGWKLRSSGHSTPLPNLIPHTHYGTCGQA
jgi:hypothetical protein